MGATFQTPVFQSFSALAMQINTVNAGAAASALLDATRPERSDLSGRPYARTVREAEALRHLIPAFSTAAPAAIFPPTVVGKTFEWNTSTNSYAPTARAGAPPNGVQFILYTINPLTGQPAIPLVEVGYVDLTDETPAAGTPVTLGIKVVGTSGAAPVTYVDYDVSVTGSPTSVSGRAVGFVTDGTTRLDFDGSFSATGTSGTGTVVIDVRFDVNARNLHVHNQVTVTKSPSSETLTIDFTLQYGSEIVTVTGTLTSAPTGDTGTLTVKVNGQTYASCTVNNDVVTCTGAGGRALTAEEINALKEIGDIIEDTLDAFEDLVDPAENILF